jgi:negative regulator of flagellin synthesis FlgM
MDINSVLRGMANNGNKSLNGLENNATRKGEDKTSDATTAMLANNSEKVTLTTTASRLGQLSMQADTSKTQVNAERVASLRAAIAEGNYKPNPASIATRLMNFENQLKG